VEVLGLFGLRLQEIVLLPFTAASNANLRMGSLLVIPPSIVLGNLALQTNLAGDTSKGPGAQLFWTLQNYGIYIVDVTGSTTTPGFSLSIEAAGTGPTASGYTQGFEAQFFNDWGYGPKQWGAGSAWANDFLLLMSNLQAVTNNTASSIGGGRHTTPTACCAFFSNLDGRRTYFPIMQL